MMAPEDGAGPSDESDFYGDDQTVRKYESFISSLTTEDLAREQEAVSRSINVISRRSKRSYLDFLEVEEKKQDDDLVLDEDNATLNNPYEGVSTARQMSESVNAFLKRMDPITIGTTLENTHWIWIADFHSSETHRVDSEEEIPKHAEFIKRGHELLNTFRDTKAAMEEKFGGHSETFIYEQLNGHRSKLKQDILNIAKICDITSGKWLLFHPDDNVQQIWSKIAHAVAAHKLGPVAKIATSSNKEDRPISVYTRDFADVADVKRVLIELVRLNVMPRDQRRHIYYKCDAYTYLGIMSKNEFGLEASLYSSRQLLTAWKESETMLQSRNKPSGRGRGRGR